jgi:hypothetical protein
MCVRVQRPPPILLTMDAQGEGDSPLRPIGEVQFQGYEVCRRMICSIGLCEGFGNAGIGWCG